MTMEAEAGIALPQAKDCPQPPRNSGKHTGQIPPGPCKKEPALIYFRSLASRTVRGYIYISIACSHQVSGTLLWQLQRASPVMLQRATLK